MAISWSRLRPCFVKHELVESEERLWIGAKSTPGFLSAANLGVLVGLVLIAVQIRQNTEITRAQVANDWFMADMQLELAMMGENPSTSWIKSVYTQAELDRHDAAVLDRYFNYGLVQLQRLQRMNELGLADEQWKD